MDVGAMWVMRKAAMAMGQIALWQRRFALSKAPVSYTHLTLPTSDLV